MKSIIPKSPLGQFLFFFIETAIACFVIVANTRAIARASYGWTTITETLFWLQSFIVWKYSVEDANGRSWAAGLGCVIGGVVASLASIWCTVHLFGG